MNQRSCLVEHSVRFYKDTSDGSYRAHCSCGWWAEHEALGELQAMAATHDLKEDEDETISPNTTN